MLCRAAAWWVDVLGNRLEQVSRAAELLEHRGEPCADVRWMVQDAGLRLDSMAKALAELQPGARIEPIALHPTASLGRTRAPGQPTRRRGTPTRSTA
jgi:hypothetical protein